MANFEKAIHPLAMIMSKDPEAIKNMERIYGQLRLSQAELIVMKKNPALDNDLGYNFFVTILVTWHGRHGTKATVKRLYNALKQIICLKACRERIAKQFKLLPPRRKPISRVAKSAGIASRVVCTKTSVTRTPKKPVARKFKSVAVESTYSQSGSNSDEWESTDEDSIPEKPNTRKLKNVHAPKKVDARPAANQTAAATAEKSASGRPARKAVSPLVESSTSAKTTENVKKAPALATRKPAASKSKEPEPDAVAEPKKRGRPPKTSIPSAASPASTARSASQIKQDISGSRKGKSVVEVVETQIGSSEKSRNKNNTEKAELKPKTKRNPVAKAGSKSEAVVNGDSSQVKLSKKGATNCKTKTNGKDGGPDSRPIQVNPKNTRSKIPVLGDVPEPQQQDPHVKCSAKSQQTDASTGRHNIRGTSPNCLLKKTLFH